MNWAAFWLFGERLGPRLFIHPVSVSGLLVPREQVASGYCSSFLEGRSTHSDNDGGFPLISNLDQDEGNELLLSLYMCICTYVHTYICMYYIVCIPPTHTFVYYALSYIQLSQVSGKEEDSVMIVLSKLLLGPGSSSTLFIAVVCKLQLLGVGAVSTVNCNAASQTMPISFAPPPLFTKSRSRMLYRR